MKKFFLCLFVLLIVGCGAAYFAVPPLVENAVRQNLEQLPAVLNQPGRANFSTPEIGKINFEPLSRTLTIEKTILKGVVEDGKPGKIHMVCRIGEVQGTMPWRLLFLLGPIRNVVSEEYGFETVLSDFFGKDVSLSLARDMVQVESAAEEISGKGIRAVFPEGTVLCGSKGLLETYQVDTEKYCGDVYGTQVLVAIDGELAGYLVIADIIKNEARSAVQRMKSQSLITAMLTGDAKDSAEAVAQQTGIDEVHAQLLPEDKLEHLRDIRKKHGAVMFVGDGINDAPVLAGADVGAAMGNGADAAIEAADVVFMTSSVDAIPEAVGIARRTGRIAMENVVFALVIKFLIMILGFLGYANMWMAVFADTGVAMLCVLNSIRVLYAGKQ